MDTFMNSSFGSFLCFLFAQHFPSRSWQSFILLAYGWSLSSSRHTVAHYIWLSGGTKYKHFSQFYCFLDRAFLRLIDQLWISLLHFVDQLLPADQVLVLVVDDRVRKKSGRKIQGASNYQNRAGSARQEYRTLWGLNFVYVTLCLNWSQCGRVFSLALPLGLRIYLKEQTALKLKRTFQCRSYLARQIIDFIIKTLPHRRFLIKADGGYSTKVFLRKLPPNTHFIGRFIINSRLFELPERSNNKVGRPPKKGKDLGTPLEWITSEQDWIPHPTEAGALIKTRTGMWHRVLPGVLITVVAVWRKDLNCPDKRSAKKQLEAFFSSDLSLTSAHILSHYAQRWTVEIDIRDGYAYYGLGKDQCRNLDRILGINTFRILMASCRTLWFIKYFQHRQLDLKYLRPWYLKKQQPSQLDVFSATQEAFALQGISPVPRFFNGTTEIYSIQQNTVNKVA